MAKNYISVKELEDEGLLDTVTEAPLKQDANGNYRTDGQLPEGYSWVSNGQAALDPEYVESNRGSWGNADNAFMSDEDWETIQKYKQQFADAQAAGDTEGMNAAHEAAQKLRYTYGYSGGADGSYYNPTMAYTGGLSDYADDYDGGISYDNANSYVSQYQAQINALYNAILNREKFSYNKDEDPLYQQYKDSYTRSGQRAMQDTLGQVSARTGGLASSYATTASQQAYNNYMAALADKVPELYQLAYSMYQDDLSNQRSDLSMLMSLDDTDYNRYRDTVSDSQWQQTFDYNAYRDSVSDSQWQQSFDYNAGRDSVSDDQWQQSFDYQKLQDALAQSNYEQEWAYQLEQDALDRQLQYAKLYNNNDGNNDGEAETQSILEAIYGMDNEAEAYNYLVNQGLSDSKIESYLGYRDSYREEQEQNARQENATLLNRTEGDYAIYISHLGTVSYDDLEYMVNSGEVQEIYDPEKNTIRYVYVGY